MQGKTTTSSKEKEREREKEREKARKDKRPLPAAPLWVVLASSGIDGDNVYDDGSDDPPVAFEDELREICLGLSVENSTFTESPSTAGIYDIDIVWLQPTIMATIEADANLKRMRYVHVPKQVKEEEFWRNYILRVALSAEAAASRRKACKIVRLYDPLVSSASTSSSADAEKKTSTTTAISPTTTTTTTTTTTMSALPSSSSGLNSGAGLSASVSRGGGISSFSSIPVGKDIVEFASDITSVSKSHVELDDLEAELEKEFLVLGLTPPSRSPVSASASLKTSSGSSGSGNNAKSALKKNVYNNSSVSFDGVAEDDDDWEAELRKELNLK
jgi:hypothetical protein